MAAECLVFKETVGLWEISPEKISPCEILAFPQMNKEVGTLLYPRGKINQVTFVLMPLLCQLPASPQLPSLEFLHVSIFVCHAVWEEIPVWLSCSDFFCLLSTSHAAVQQMQVQGCFYKEWSWESNVVGPKRINSCGQYAALPGPMLPSPTGPGPTPRTTISLLSPMKTEASSSGPWLLGS